MITTVTLNAAIDKTYYLPSFPLAQVTRVRRMFAEPGGKGLNVARVIRHLGYPVTATGILGGGNGRFIESMLTAQGIVHDFIRIEDESRLCLNFIDESNGTSTEVLEPGSVVSEKAWRRFKTKLTDFAGRSRIVCFCGSLPLGIPRDGYAQLIRIAKQAGCLAFLDASGEALIHGVKACPDFVKPNQDEIVPLLASLNEGTIGGHLPGALRRLQQTGIPRITVSLGAEGSITAAGGAVHRVRAPKIEVVNTVGCGDSFVAGMALATLQGFPTEQCVQWATAAAASNALTHRAGYVNCSDVERLKSLITVELI